jgi:hypothetical protein
MLSFLLVQHCQSPEDENLSTFVSQQHNGECSNVLYA